MVIDARFISLRICILLLTIFLGIGLSSCITGTPSPTQTIPATLTPLEPTPTVNLLPLPAETPFQDPLGSQGNPLVMGVAQETENLHASALIENVVQQISTQADLAVTSQVFPDYAELLQAMNRGEVHLAWLPPLTYLSASERGYAEAALITNHFGVYSYGFQLLAHIDSGFIAFFDPLTNQSTVDARLALRQFQEKLPCWVTPDSPSGHVIPLGYLNSEAVILKEGAYLQDHASVVRALYVGGICDFGATFATYGDPRTTSSIQEEFPDVMEKIQVIWQSDPVIPNLNLSFLPEIPDNFREKVINALLNYVKTEEGKANLTTAYEYDIQGLRIIDDSYYDDLRFYTEESLLRLSELIGK